MTEGRESQTSHSSRDNGKNGIAINRDAGEDSLGRRSWSLSLDMSCCDASNSSTRSRRQRTRVSGAEGREGTGGDI